MLRTLFTIAERYKEKRIYIYGINRNAINVFTELVYRGADVCGFVDSHNRCIGQYFMNRPIQETTSVMGKKNVVIIISKFYEKAHIQNEILNTEICYITEILDVDLSLGEKRVVIYGLGKRGEEIYKLLKEKKIEICDVCESEKSKDTWMEMQVRYIRDLNIDSDTAVIIATKIEKYKREMIRNIGGCAGDIVVDEIVDNASIIQGNIFWVINKAVNEKKDIYLYKSRTEELRFLKDILARYQVSVAGEVSEDEIVGKESINIYDLAYKNVNEVVVVIPEWDAKRSESICDILDEIGFSLEKHNYTSIHPEARKYKDAMNTVIDCLVGHASRGNGKLQGYVVYGEEKRGCLKIMVLGGSTSTDGYYRTKSWVNLFFHKIERSGIEVVLYNGAACGYDIVQELLRLMRDGNIIKPDYVISMSGVNNTNRKMRTDNQFCVVDFLNWIKALDRECEYSSGINDNEVLYDFWNRNAKIMKMICELLGAKFYGFLQPINIGIKNAGLNEISMYEQDDCLSNTNIFREKVMSEREHIYTNLIDLFDKKENMYIDNCHYSNKANDIIANIVYDTLWTDIEERMGH
jgi:hypothetical protein